MLRKALLKSLAVVGAFALGVAMLSNPAEAQSRSAAFVMDAKTGKVLFQENADAARYPASLTKIMTLYILFQELESGTVTLSTPLRASANAAAQPPSKIGIRPGETITVEDAIKALVTKSANDVAVVIAENLEGTVAAFAQRMTRTARALGMRNTTYHNPHGLPDNRQRTTARDLAILSLAIQDHYPREFRYFSTRSFTWRGRHHGNHNRLLGSVPGVNGIKTGFIRASGFNLSTNVERNGRHLVAVVMGGSTGAARDARMRKLIETYIDKASSGRRTYPQVARPGRSGSSAQIMAAAPTGKVPLPVPSPRPVMVASAAPVAAAAMAATAAPLTITPPALPQAAPVPAAQPMTTASVGDRGARKPVDLVRQAHSAFTPAAITATAGANTPSSQALAMTTTPPAMRWVTGPKPIQTTETSATPVEQPAPVPAPHMAALEEVSAAASEPITVAAEPETQPVVRSAWLIQIAATDSEDRAMSLLERAQSRAGGVLSNAEPFTEPVTKGEQTLYRARFAGFDDQRTAQAACQTLKRQDIACFATRSN